MAITVLKYLLTEHGINTCMMPSGSEVLRVGMQSTNIVAWVRCNNANPLVERRIVSCFTGQPLPLGHEKAPYVTTLQIRGQNEKGEVQELVVHFFDGGEGPGFILPR